MTTTAVATIESAGIAIDHQAILKSLNLDVRQASTQALLMVCERYGLDPLLRHMVLISGNPFITRDGLLAVAHRSKDLDGIVIVEQGETSTHYTAKASVYRKSMTHPFTFPGRFPKAKPMAKEFGPEMAEKVAISRALRHAFNVSVPTAEERWDTDEVVSVDAPTPALTAGNRTAPAEPAPKPTRTRRPPPTAAPAPAHEPFPEDEPAEQTATEEQRAAVVTRLDAIPMDYRNALADRWRERGIHSIKMPAHFTVTDAEKAAQLLTEFEASIAAAQSDDERPFEGDSAA